MVPTVQEASPSNAAIAHAVRVQRKAAARQGPAWPAVLPCATAAPCTAPVPACRLCTPAPG